MNQFQFQRKSPEVSQVQEETDGYYNEKEKPSLDTNKGTRNMNSLFQKEKYLARGHQVDHKGSGQTASWFKSDFIPDRTRLLMVLRDTVCRHPNFILRTALHDDDDISHIVMYVIYNVRIYSIVSCNYVSQYLSFWLHVEFTTQCYCY